MLNLWHNQRLCLEEFDDLLISRCANLAEFPKKKHKCYHGDICFPFYYVLWSSTVIHSHTLRIPTIDVFYSRLLLIIKM